MSAPPLTVLAASEQEANAIREAIRTARHSEALGGSRAILRAEHIPAFYELLRDPVVSGPIYVIEKPVTLASVTAWANDLIAAHARGEGLTLLRIDEAGEIFGFTEIIVWPDRASAEIGGALRADRQSAGEGAKGFARAVAWLFDEVGVRLIALTAALDNVRSQRMIDGLGFIRMGERDCVRPDGGVRPSVYWELPREAWRARQS